MKKYLSVFFLLILIQCSYSQIKIDPSNIEIVRDSFGVPHIFAPTDAEAAYGIAWAQCEDNFKVMQENMAILRGQAGRLLGKDGAALDFIAQIFELDEFVDSRYEQDIDPTTEKLIQYYIAGLDAYSKSHPEEIIVRNYTTPTVKEILAAYSFNFILLTTAVFDVAKLAGGKMDLYKSLGNFHPKGSNGMAFSPEITSVGKTYLVANPHLPTDGPVRFWELRVHTDENMDMYGATFTGGGITPMIATNRNLGWTHTTNFDDYSDVFRLEMHPTKKGYYKFDDEYLELEEKKVKLKVKIGPLVIPVGKKYYKSVHGPVLKNKEGYFAIRCNSLFNIKHIGQWYKMGIADNYDEFYSALDILGLPSQTVTYADKESNIMHINYALMPNRAPGYEWRSIVPGNTSKTLWSLDEMAPLGDLVQVKNPKSGFVFNCNNTPFDCTGDSENPKEEDYPKEWGILSSNTARAIRLKELVNGKEKLSFKDIKAIRDDYSYPSNSLNFRQMMNMNDIFDMAASNPDYADISELLQKWDRKMDVKNKEASLIALVSMHIEEQLFEQYALYDNILPESMLLDAFKFARKFLNKNYGTLYVELGEIQKMVRGNKELPMYGSPNTLANCHCMPHTKGKIRIVHGDTFIMYAKYGDAGLESLKTINLYGNSDDPESPHFTDQMELYTNQKVKTMELNLEKIKAKAVRRYHPE